MGGLTGPLEHRKDHHPAMKMEPKSRYRPLTRHEQEILDKLLEPSFPGRDELRAQVKLVEAREIDDDGCIEFSTIAAARADVKFNIPTEGEYRDSTSWAAWSRSSSSIKKTAPFL